MQKKQYSVLKKTIIIIAALVSAVAAAFVLYAAIYYHADETAEAILNAPEAGVQIRECHEKEIIFLPVKVKEEIDSAETGLIFYPGGKVENTAYAPLLEFLTRQGITCFLVEMPANLAIMDMDAADRILEEHPEIRHWYITGHSLGGAAAAMYLEERADEFEGLILLGAYSTVDLSQSGLRVLSIYGENDGVMNREKYEENRGNLPADYTEVIIPGGCHAYFGSYGEQKGDGEAAITPQEQQEQTAREIVQFVFAGENSNNRILTDHQ